MFNVLVSSARIFLLVPGIVRLLAWRNWRAVWVGNLVIVAESSVVIALSGGMAAWKELVIMKHVKQALV
jgi:hypothetical protein